ncbi:MAG: sulfoxide reductase heme-binding subunit YedZ [Gammaproteobacteria bacterium]
MSPSGLRGLKVAVFGASLAPFVLMALATFGVAGSLGANPVEELINRTGGWGLKFLLITLAVTPLRRITGWHWLIRFRRMLGLFAFFYVLLHFTTYAVIDHRLDLAIILEDVVERPFITLGAAALLLLIPLAATSTTGMMRRLGKRWQQLHRLVYVIAVLGVWHFWWQVKQDIREPLLYAAILALLLGYRAWYRWRHAPGRASGATRDAPAAGARRTAA